MWICTVCLLCSEPFLLESSDFLVVSTEYFLCLYFFLESLLYYIYLLKIEMIFLSFYFFFSKFAFNLFLLLIKKAFFFSYRYFYSFILFLMLSIFITNILHFISIFISIDFLLPLFLQVISVFENKSKPYS